MAGNRGVPCPSCGAPLVVALDVVVGARLTQLPTGGYGIGAVEQSSGELGRRLKREHYRSDGNGLYFDGEGYVVQCSTRPRCEFIGTLLEDGTIETEADRREQHAERVRESAAEPTDL